MRTGNPATTTPGILLPALLASVLFLAAAGVPASAHTAAEMGVAPDQYDQGIPVSWPYHAFLMSAGFVCLVSGSLVQRFSRRPERFRIHRQLQLAGAGAVLAGLAVAVFMVSLSAAPHVRYLHDQPGAGIILLMLIAVALGFSIARRPAEPAARTGHRFTGWIAVGLMAVNIIPGITMMAMVLAQ